MVTRLEGSESVAVSVGAGQRTQKWHLPKNLLTNVSPFFAAALTGSFAEAFSNSITLPEDDPGAFEVFIHWLYVGIYDSDDVVVWAPKSSTNAWVLGDKLGCPVFQDLAMDRLIDHHKNVKILAETLRLAYPKSTPGSKLRQYALDQFRWDMKWKCPLENVEEQISIIQGIEDIGLDFVRSHMTITPTAFKDPSERKNCYLIGNQDVDRGSSVGSQASPCRPRC